MPKGYVETKSGSRVRPPRYGVSPSCSPLWRRYRHDCSTGNARPWRRLYDIPERPWAGYFPPVRGQRGHQFLSGARSRRGLSGRLRPVGPVAATQGAGGVWRGRRTDDQPRPWESGEPGGTGGSVRARAGDGPDRCVHPPGDSPGQPGALRGAAVGLALAGRAAAGGHGARLRDPGDAAIADARGRSVGCRHSKQDKQQTKHPGGQGAGGRSARVTALPDPPYPTPLGRPAGHRGGEP